MTPDKSATDPLSRSVKAPAGGPRIPPPPAGAVLAELNATGIAAVTDLAYGARGKDGDWTDLDLAKKHRYIVESGGAVMPGVTTICGVLDMGDKAGRMAGAAAKLTREGKDYRKEWNAKRDRGSRIHEHALAWSQNRDVEVLASDEGHMDALEKFHTDNSPLWIANEIVVGNAEFGYGGCLDAIAILQTGEHAGYTALLDWKGGSAYPLEHGLQLVAYSAAQVVLYQDGMVAATQLLPDLDVLLDVYLTEDGTYSIAEVTEIDALLVLWERLCATYHAAKACREKGIG